LYFDRSHWWKNDSSLVCLESGTYELLRRHPSVEEIHRTQQPYKDENTDCLQGFLQCSGLKSWPALPDSEKQWFFDVLRERYPGNGRDLTQRVFSITSQSVDLTQGIDPSAALAIVPKLSAEDRKTADEARLNEIRRLAGEHHQEGRILIAISPNFGSLEDALDLFEKCFLQHRKKPAEIGRSRFKDWLPIIAEFEEGEDKLTATTIRNADLFRRYKDIFKDVRLQKVPSKSPLLQKLENALKTRPYQETPFKHRVQKPR
jgi:hypothetical protein